SWGMDLAFELHDLVRTLDAWADRALRGVGLSYHRYVVLLILSEHPDLTGRQLAGAVGVSEPAMSGQTRALLADGLVTNTATAGAGNVRRWRLTAAGTSRLAECSDLLGDSLDRNARAIGIDPASL